MQINKPGCDILGYSREQLLGVDWLEKCIPKAHRKEISEVFQRIMRSEMELTEYHVNPVLRSDGQSKSIRWHNTLLRNKKGHIYGSLSLGVDVSEKLAAQNALAESEAHAKAILDTAVDAIVTIDRAGYIQTFNTAASMMFGYAAGEVIGLNIKILMPDPYQSEHDGYLHNYLHTGEKKIIGIGREVSGLRKNGETFPIDLSVSEVVVGDSHSFTGIIRDLTEEKKREAELQRQQEEIRINRDRVTHMTRISTLGEMAAGIAHEINQPLTAISNYAQACNRMVENGLLAEAETLDALRKISAQALRAGDVIRKMRNLVRQTENERGIEDINEVIHDCVALAEYEGRLRNIGLHLELEAGVVSVYIDRVQIQQVILNLVRNAQDAMEHFSGEAPAILVTSKNTDDETIVVSVRDFGQGIDLDSEQNLYQHFFTTKAAGMGIGLAVSRTIIESHGGRLWFSRNEDCGVTFHFSLPNTSEDNI